MGASGYVFKDDILLTTADVVFDYVDIGTGPATGPSVGAPRPSAAVPTIARSIMARSTPAEFVAPFLGGGLIGAGLALLLAPRSGRETREILDDRLRFGLVRGREMSNGLVDRARTMVDEAADYVERQRLALQWQKDRVASAIEAGREAYRQEKAALDEIPHS
jgi:gas vesicle protein